MPEYIERADVAEFFEKTKQTMWHKDDIAATISSKKNIPSADVVEVVRCKGCKHYNTNSCADGFGWCEKHNRGEMDEHYCSYGKRRTETLSTETKQAILDSFMKGSDD